MVVIVQITTFIFAKEEKIMKIIFQGKVLDTEMSNYIGIGESEDCSKHDGISIAPKDIMYQTRQNEYFLQKITLWKKKDTAEILMPSRIEPLSIEEALEWIELHLSNKKYRSIVNKVMYDVETSTCIGVGISSDPDYFYYDYFIVEVLYQKQDGEFFILTDGIWKDDNGVCCMTASNIKPLSVEEARSWAERNLSVEKYSTLFDIAMEIKIS